VRLRAGVVTTVGALTAFSGRLQCKQRTTSERVDRWHDLQ
jgi:hypothetical protein